MTDRHFIPVDSPITRVASRKMVASSADMDQLYTAMMTSDNILLPHKLMMELYKSPHIANRRGAIDWARKVLSADSTDVRDTAVRIFDTYLAMSFAENPEVLKDTTFLAFSAVAAIIISSKLLSSTNYVSPSWFTAFNTEDILFFERQIVMKTGSRMSTLATPAYFVDYVVSLLCSEEVGGQVNKEQILQMVNTIIGEFWEDGASLLFAPSTIAISAVIMSLSLLRMDCSKLVDSLPEFLLPNRAFPFFLEEDGKSMYLDVNTCMKAMERLTYIRSTYMTRSPTSVADEAFSKSEKK